MDTRRFAKCCTLNANLYPTSPESSESNVPFIRFRVEGWGFYTRTKNYCYEMDRSVTCHKTKYGQMIRIAMYLGLCCPERPSTTDTLRRTRKELLAQQSFQFCTAD